VQRFASATAQGFSPQSIFFRHHQLDQTLRFFMTFLFCSSQRCSSASGRLKSDQGDLVNDLKQQVGETSGASDAFSRFFAPRHIFGSWRRSPFPLMLLFARWIIFRGALRSRRAFPGI